MHSPEAVLYTTIVLLSEDNLSCSTIQEYYNKGVAV